MAGCTNAKDKAFEKKKECAKYKDDIQQTLKENDSIDISFHILEEIFYSPALNSCLYTYKRTFIDYKNLGYELYIIDYLSNKTVWYRGSTMEPDVDELFRKELEFYKK